MDSSQEINLSEIEDVYKKLFGYVPKLTEARHEITLQVRQEDLSLHEQFRLNSMVSAHIPEKYVQLMLFGMLIALMTPGAKVHLIASRRAGATWDELYDVAKLSFLFRGLSAFNLACLMMKEVQDSEAADKLIAQQAAEGGKDNALLSK